MGKRHIWGIVALVACSVLAGTALFAGAGQANATSRAAHRWMHDPTAPASSASASSPAPSPADPAAGATTLVVHELFGSQFTPVDVGPEGDSPGDYGVFRDVLARPGTHEHLGFIDVQCVEAYSSRCFGSIRLSGQGQIVFAGATPSTIDPDRFAVTGGTGKLRGITGELVISFPRDHYAELTLHLMSPR